MKRAMLRYRLLDDALRIARLRHITLNRDRLSLAFLNLLDYLISRCRIRHVVDRDVCALFGEAERNSAPDAPRAARDERSFSRQIEHRSLMMVAPSKQVKAARARGLSIGRSPGRRHCAQRTSDRCA